MQEPILGPSKKERNDTIPETERPGLADRLCERGSRVPLARRPLGLLGQRTERVDRGPANPDLEVQVGPGRDAGRADASDHRPRGHAFPERDGRGHRQDACDEDAVSRAGQLRPYRPIS